MRYLVNHVTRNFGRKLSIFLALFIVVSSGCGGGGSGSAPAAPPSVSALDVFDALWNDFDVSYSFFDLKGIDWNGTRTRFRTQLSTLSTDSDLFAVLSDMLVGLEDPHVRLNTPIGNSVYTAWFDQYPANFDQTVISATYLGASAMMSPQVNMLFGNVDADIGYLHVHSLSGSGHGADIDFILSQLSGVRALIVDLRNNGGGNDQNGEAIAARFTDASRLYRRVRFRDGPSHSDFGPFIDSFISPGGSQSFSGPITVLTNRSTISSAESLLLAFNVIPNAVTVGDFSGGGSANPAQRTLPNGWQYTVSRWVEFRPDGTTFEGVGIEPDIRIDISSTDAAALRDSIMDGAISNLRSRIVP